MVLQIVLPEPNNDANSRHHNRASSRVETRIYDINPSVAGAALDPRKSWYRGGIPPPGVLTAAAANNGEPSFNSLCESRIGEDSLFSYGYGVQPRDDTTDGSEEVLTRLRSGVIRDSEVKHSPGLFQYSEMPSLPRSTPPRAFGNISSEEDKNSVFKGYLTAILSCIYAIFILMLGVVVYIADLISRTATLAEVFSVYLVTLGLIWLIFLYCDIRQHQGGGILQMDPPPHHQHNHHPRGSTVSQTTTTESSGSSSRNNHNHRNNIMNSASNNHSSRESRYHHNHLPHHLKFWNGGNSSSGGGKCHRKEFHRGKQTQRSDSVKLEDGTSHLSVSFTPSNEPCRIYSSDSYTFCRSRHSGSFYLKIGAAGFCFGHLIHSGLLLCRQIIFFTTDDEKVFNRCANVANLILDILFPIYSFFLLFVIFKYSNVIINRHQEISRFALMHCISSSLCFWFWSILRETADSLYHKMTEHSRRVELHNSSHPLAHHHIPESLDSITPLAYTNRMIEEESHQNAFAFLNATSAITSFYDPCVEFSTISELVLKMSPYLYPFSIEYSILVVGVLFIMWQNIGKGKRIGHHSSHCLDHHNSPAASFTNHLIIHADCHSANKGLFAGLLVLVGTVVSVIIFYIALDDSSSGFAAQWVNLTSQMGLLILMIITVLCAYRQITKLDVNMNPVSLLDDLLLFLCLPSFFLYTIFTVVPAIAHQDYYAIVVCTLQVVQVILQTPCIIDGLRRCSNSEKLRQEKPGRELVTFLIVCNIAMWIIETFEIKSIYAQQEQVFFYGSILWTLLSHMTLPLTLFYRFHSSVCLVDIWKSAYEAGEQGPIFIMDLDEPILHYAGFNDNEPILNKYGSYIERPEICKNSGAKKWALKIFATSLLPVLLLSWHG